MCVSFNPNEVLELRTHPGWTHCCQLVLWLVTGGGRGSKFCRQKRLSASFGSVTARPVMVDKALSFSEPQFPQVDNKHDGSVTHSAVWGEGRNEPN
jgi:hypothetical protein